MYVMYEVVVVYSIEVPSALIVGIEDVNIVIYIQQNLRRSKAGSFHDRQSVAHVSEL